MKKLYVKDARKKGHTNIVPSLRACDFCLEHNLQCVRRVFLVVTLDCESGNKQVLDGAMEPSLSLVSSLPDVPHVMKTCKASFANWYLQLSDERGCLSVFCTLRNRAEPAVRKEVKFFLKRNDYVRNRDRQNPSVVLVICHPEFLKYISNIGKISIFF